MKLSSHSKSKCASHEDKYVPISIFRLNTHTHTQSQKDTVDFLLEDWQSRAARARKTGLSNFGWYKLAVFTETV